MGNIIWKAVQGSSKRKIEEVNLDGDEDDSYLNVPKRRCLKCTSEYIFKTLFEEGQESDVKIMALGSQWNLHKVYLCQSPYFSSMFSGNWKEANEPVINIEILDDTITVESLHIALGSFYRDEIEIDSSQVIQLMATAILLQMDSIIEQCKAVMKETITVKTVLKYHSASCRYGINEMEEACKEWLLHNLLTEVTENPEYLRQTSLPLMQELVSSPHLFAIQTEYSIYLMLKVWVFLQLHPTWDGRHEAAFLEAHNYFKNKNREGFFLEEEGSEYKSVFECIRIKYILFHYLDVEMLHSDRILPHSWLQPAATQQWYAMLKVEQKEDFGPSNLPEEIFNKHCNRCGRVIHNSSQHIWRWTGYNFGLDIVLTYDNHSLKLKRSQRTEHPASVGQQTRRHIMYRITLVSLNEDGRRKQVVHSHCTGIKSVALSKNEEIPVILPDLKLKHPLLLSANFLITTPKEVFVQPEQVDLD